MHGCHTNARAYPVCQLIFPLPPASRALPVSSFKECRRLGYRSRPVRLPPAVAPSVEDLEAYELELGVAAAMRESPTDWAAVL